MFKPVIYRMCRKPVTAKGSGFSLVELLVAMGVLILLAALLFPAFSRAREAAKRSSCMNNLRQVAVGIDMYSQDYNRRYPAPPPEPSDGSTGWALAVADITKNDNIFQCPSESRGKLDGFTDYWMNSGLLGEGTVRVTTPASVILTGEGEGSPVDYALGATQTGEWLAWDASMEYCVRHNAGANYAFADGHVKFILPGEISTAAPDGKNFTLTAN